MPTTAPTPATTPVETTETPERVVLRADAVSVAFPRKRMDPFLAVDDVSLELRAGEILGLVGESGSGKSTLGRVLAGFQEPTAGSIDVPGSARAGARRRLGRPEVQMIFQDSSSALDPRARAVRSVAEGLAGGGRIRPAHLRSAREYLELVGLTEAHGDRLPRQLSGGQRQRVAIARAIAAEPDVLVCDEAVSALDVAVRAAIIALLARIRSERGISMVFISHDISVVSQIADRVLVMHQGRMVEVGTVDQVIHNPSQPYTQRLLAALPRLEREGPRPTEAAG